MTPDNKRNFYRLSLSAPLTGTLKIVGLNEKKLDSKLALVFMLDLGAGGMRIHAHHNFPVTPDLLLEFRFTLFHSEHRCLGTLVRKSSHSDTVYEYGVVFSLDENERQALLQNINMLNIKLRHATKLTSCSFSTDEEIESFYKVSAASGIPALQA
ncbi:PilZ domain-containing protein [Paenibacillus hemerocallicola]|nr:PilZ domain-containing protein [Paenibacillus hemerocallicola]